MKPLNVVYIIFLSLSSLASEVATYEQSDYILSTERAFIRSYNKKNAIVTVNFFKYNRTYTALNATFILKRNFGNNINVEGQAYKFASNEYRLFPVSMSFELCSTLQKNEFGVNNLYNCGNFTGCPFVQGRFHICNWGPDYSKFPPYLPRGQYMILIKYKYFEEEVAIMEWYLKIESVCQVC